MTAFPYWPRSAVIFSLFGRHIYSVVTTDDSHTRAPTIFAIVVTLPLLLLQLILLLQLLLLLLLLLLFSTISPVTFHQTTAAAGQMRRRAVGSRAPQHATVAACRRRTVDGGRWMGSVGGGRVKTIIVIL